MHYFALEYFDFIRRSVRDYVHISYLLLLRRFRKSRPGLSNRRNAFCRNHSESRSSGTAGQPHYPRHPPPHQYHYHLCFHHNPCQLCHFHHYNHYHHSHHCNHRFRLCNHHFSHPGMVMKYICRSDGGCNFARSKPTS